MRLPRPTVPFIAALFGAFSAPLLPSGPAAGQKAAGDGTENLSGILERVDVLLLDTETTGTTRRSVIVEVAIFDTTGQERYHSYFQLPTGSGFQRRAAQITGLSRERLRRMEAKNFDKEWPELKSTLEQAALVLAWNASFVNRLLNQTLRKWRIEGNWRWKIVDLLEKFRCGIPKLASYSLEDIAESYSVSIPEDALHTAKGDVRILLEVMRAAARGDDPKILLPHWANDLATDKQLNYIDSLAYELDMELRSYPKTKWAASKRITELKCKLESEGLFFPLPSSPR